MSKRTYQPSRIKRKRTHGFRKKMQTKSGRQSINRRRARGRKLLTVSIPQKQFMDKCYPRLRRLPKSWEYQLVRKMGCKFNAPHFILLVFENSVKSSRLGITVSRKVGNSVQRNRLKRMVREFFRNNRSLYSDLLDYSVIAKSSAARLSFSEISSELDKVFLKSATRND